MSHLGLLVLLATLFVFMEVCMNIELCYRKPFDSMTANLGGNRSNSFQQFVRETTNELENKGRLHNNSNSKDNKAMLAVSAFEDLLDEKNIEIPCEDAIEQQDRYEGGNDAKLYGMEYYDLVDKVKDIL